MPASTTCTVHRGRRCFRLLLLLLLSLFSSVSSSPCLLFFAPTWISVSATATQQPRRRAVAVGSGVRTTAVDAPPLGRSRRTVSKVVAAPIVVGAFDNKKDVDFQAESVCDTAFSQWMEHPPPTGDVLCKEGHSAEEYVRQARGILSQHFPPGGGGGGSERTPPQSRGSRHVGGTPPPPLKMAFLAERLLRCSLVRDDDDASGSGSGSGSGVTWALLAEALQQKLRHSRGGGFPSAAVSSSICSSIKWALQLSPTNPDVLDVATRQLTALSELWSAAAVDHLPDIQRLQSVISALEERLYANFSSKDASEHFRRGWVSE